ncbi:MAG TPA: serine hydrolase domain-containing protein [Gemmatimonadaceae bacterium]|nr:serine hydrolase domain-containing protein [Gemmatimonadaceae bacterium]
MIDRTIRLILACSLSTASTALVAQQPETFPRAAAEEVGMSSEKLRGVVTTVQKWVDDDRIVGAILLVIRNGRTVLHEAVGWSDRERKLPMRTDHIVSMRSMTKPLVGAAALILREEGKLKLEDRVSQFLPSFDNPKARDITIFQLLTHTSGIRGEIYVATGGTQYKTLREAVDAVGAKGPDFAPGTDYFYSDPGTSTVGAVIADRAGMPSEDFIRTRILEPLGMKDSFLVDDPASPLRARVAAAYRRERDGPWIRYWDNTMPPVVPFFRASGGLYSTALDYARFMAAMLGQGTLGNVRILAPESVKLATQPHADYVYRQSRREQMDRFYGLNWEVRTDKYRTVEAPFTAGTFSHAGSDGTLAWADPARNLIVIYITQSRGTDTRMDFMRQVYGSFIR